MTSNIPPDPSAAPHRLARIRQAVLEFGRIAYSDSTVQSDWPAEAFRFLGRAGAILGIEHEEYTS